MIQGGEIGDPLPKREVTLTPKTLVIRVENDKEFIKRAFDQMAEDWGLKKGRTKVSDEQGGTTAVQSSISLKKRRWYLGRLKTIVNNLSTGFLKDEDWKHLEGIRRALEKEWK